MPSNVNINGKTVYTPGIYGQVDASALGGKTTSTGNLAIVGAFPSLEQNTPTTFTSPQALRTFDPNDVDLQRLAKLAFSPATDDRVGGANTLTLVNAQTCTQALYEYNTFGIKSFILKSKKYGFRGNQVYVKLTSNATDTKKTDVVLNAAGKTELYSALGTGTVASFRSACTELVSGSGDTSTISIDSASLKWAWTRHLTGGSGVVDTFTDNKLLVSGKITVTTTEEVVGADTCTIVANGLNASGLALKAGVVFSVHAVGEAKALKVMDGVSYTADDAVFSRIDDIEWTGTGAYDTAPVMSGYAFDLDLTKFTTVADLANFINNYTAKGWSVSVAGYPQVAVIPATEIDKRSDVQALIADATFRSDVWAVLKALNNSDLITAERSTGTNNGMTMPPPFGMTAGTTIEVNLAGGTEGSAPISTAYDTALQTIEHEDIQVVVGMGTDVTIAQSLITHCKNAALAGTERSAYFGCPASTSLADVFGTYVGPCNSRHLSVCAQQIKVANPLTGATETLDPQYQAVQAAAIKCGTGTAIPGTNKRPTVLGTVQSWTLQLDDEEVQQKGIYAYTKDRLGYKVLRSLTSWVQDDNPVFSETSANDSVNYSIRNLRDQLNQKIGDPAKMSPNQLKGIVETVLAKQKQDEFIYDWKNVVIVKIADKYRIDYDIAPMFPFNFGVVYAHAYVG